mmetsp:Transcript_16967/g.46964  ORF Transcript_16967/g.46964 Transcript_16967/m.46964 type:complete len:146 (-) Transcript_16967:166-603(-)
MITSAIRVMAASLELSLSVHDFSLISNRANTPLLKRSQVSFCSCQVQRVPPRWKRSLHIYAVLWYAQFRGMQAEPSWIYRPITIPIDFADGVSDVAWLWSIRYVQHNGGAQCFGCVDSDLMLAPSVQIDLEDSNALSRPSDKAER